MCFVMQHDHDGNGPLLQTNLTIDETLMEQFDCCIQIVDNDNSDSGDSNESTGSADDDGFEQDMPELILRKYNVVTEDNDDVDDDLPDLLPGMDDNTIGKDMDTPARSIQR